MRRILLGAVALALLVTCSASVAQERADLATPITITISSVEVATVTLSRLPEWEIVAVCFDDRGRQYMDHHREAEAQALVTALNKADLSAKSLERRILEHMVAEGKLPAATITGTPR